MSTFTVYCGRHNHIEPVVERLDITPYPDARNPDPNAFQVKGTLACGGTVHFIASRRNVERELGHVLAGKD